MPRWTEEARQKQADRIRQTRPWRHSTGPRTAAGKARASRNAFVHGGRSAGMRELSAALTASSRFIRMAFAAIRLRDEAEANRLMRQETAAKNISKTTNGLNKNRRPARLALRQNLEKSGLFPYRAAMNDTVNSLGFAKPPAQTRVVVAMSGGVDSSVVAALLHEQGYEVVGVTLQLYDHGAALAKKGACCAGQDIHDASRVAADRGFPHYVLNYESNFREAVIDEFADAYLRGETPVPCIRCNQTVKFRDLLRVARDLGADCLATGHYVQRVVRGGRAELHRAADPAKDQSYFLFATTQEQLDFLRFPLGAWPKERTRAEAERLGLLNAAKPDSQDICFVPGGDYAAIVKRQRPQAGAPGEIVHLDGRVMGRHDGIVHYTIGQRRGLGIGGGNTGASGADINDPFYVIDLDATAARVIVGPKAALARDVLHLKDCNWLTAGTPPAQVAVKFRSMMAPAPAALAMAPDGTATLTLSAPHYGIAPGQAAVFYAMDDGGGRVLGGGWIAATSRSLDKIAPASDKTALQRMAV